MTLAKAEIIYDGINDAYNKITIDFKDRKSFERKLELLNLKTAFNMYLMEATTKIKLLEVELNSVCIQLDMLAEIRNKGFFTEEDSKLEAFLLKRKEDIRVSIHELKVETVLDIPEELMTQITSWYE